MKTKVCQIVATSWWHHLWSRLADWLKALVSIWREQAQAAQSIWQQSWIIVDLSINPGIITFALYWWNAKLLILSNLITFKIAETKMTSSFNKILPKVCSSSIIYVYELSEKILSKSRNRIWTKISVKRPAHKLI